MRKMFQYRIYPTRKQLHKLDETLEECRWLYNHLLEMRKHAYAQTGKGLTCYEQQSTYPLLKQERPSLERIHSQVLQNVAVRLDLAFKAFFRRCQVAETPASLVSVAKSATIASPFPKVASASPMISRSRSP